MGITKRSILLGSSERVHIALRQKQSVEQKLHGHGHIRGRALPPWPLGTARRAVRRGRRYRRSRIQGDRGASAQRRRTQEGSATGPEAWERKPTAEAVLCRLRRRAPCASTLLDSYQTEEVFSTHSQFTTTCLFSTTLFSESDSRLEEVAQHTDEQEADC